MIFYSGDYTQEKANTETFQIIVHRFWVDIDTSSSKTSYQAHW